MCVKTHGLVWVGFANMVIIWMNACNIYLYVYNSGCETDWPSNY
jgi:hypothetical protein